MSRRTNLFLTELVVDLFLFALSAAVCVGLLVHARSMSQESGELTDAVYVAQSAAELWRAGTQPPAQLEGYQITVQEDLDSGAVRSCTIAVARDGRLIYTLEGVTCLDET